MLPISTFETNTSHRLEWPIMTNPRAISIPLIIRICIWTELNWNEDSFTLIEFPRWFRCSTKFRIQLTSLQLREPGLELPDKQTEFDFIINGQVTFEYFPHACDNFKLFGVHRAAFYLTFNSLAFPFFSRKAMLTKRKCSTIAILYPKQSHTSIHLDSQCLIIIEWIFLQYSILGEWEKK